MKSIASVMSEMKDAGAPFDAVMIAVNAIEEYRGEVERLRLVEAEKRRRKTEQKRSERDLSREVEATVARLSRDRDGDMEATVAPTVASQPTSPPPPKRYNQPPTSTPSVSVEARARAWFADEFWPGWPDKVAKQAAERAAIKLFRDRRGDMAAVIEGRDRYVETKPLDRPWMHPATFLNGGRFNDRPAASQPRAGPSPPRSSDGLDEARRMLRERTNGRDHHENQGRDAGASVAADAPSRGRAGEQDRDTWAGPQLDLVAGRSH